MKNLRLILIYTLTLLTTQSFAQSAQNKKLFKQAFSEAAEQYKVLAQNLPADKFPKTYFPKTDKYEWSGSGWWCSGFYPGSLLYIYEQTKDHATLTEANRILKVLEKASFHT